MSVSSVEPVFLKNRDIPDSENRISGLDLCLAGEQSSGRGSIVGAQDIRGLWRIYPATRQARNDLLTKGMTVRNCCLQVAGTNPFILKDAGYEKPATKVWVSDLPISVASNEIENSLSQIGCELRSKIMNERYRDADGKLTRFETGRRFVFISIPSIPLEKTLRIANFTAKIYHKEQKPTKKVCSRCLADGHYAKECTSEVVCLACRKPGHKRGDACCQGLEFEPSGDSGLGAVGGSEKDMRAPDAPRDNLSRDSVPRNNGPARAKDTVKDAQDDANRGRKDKKQSTLDFARAEQQRPRSATPKRHRSDDQEPQTPRGKQTRKSLPSDERGRESDDSDSARN